MNSEDDLPQAIEDHHQPAPVVREYVFKVEYVEAPTERTKIVQELLHLWRLAQAGAPGRFGTRVAGDLGRWLISNGIPEEEL